MCCVLCAVCCVSGVAESLFQMFEEYVVEPSNRKMHVGVLMSGCDISLICVFQTKKLDRPLNSTAKKKNVDFVLLLDVTNWTRFQKRFRVARPKKHLERGKIFMSCPHRKIPFSL